METKKDCNSNPPSDPRDEAPKKTPNAFTPEFLKKLYDREDAPLAALEAELLGRRLMTLV